MKNIFRYAISVFVTFAFIVLPISSQAGSQSGSIAFNAIYAFGDSLSDTGNDFILTGKVAPPSADYYQGRFSNGPVAFEYLWKALTRNYQATLRPSLGNVNYTTDKAVNFAYGGATTQISNLTPGPEGFLVDGLVGQVNNFIKINNIKPDKKTLYALWAGPNDYLLPPELLSSAVQNPDCSNIAAGPVYPVEPVVCNIADAIKKLYLSVGARYFIVPNLPNLGSLPIVNNPVFYNPNLFPQNNPPEFFKQLTIAHNNALKSALNQLEQNYPDIHIIYVDIYSISDILIQIFPHGSQAGPAGYCLFTGVCNPLSNGFKAPGYVFWDVEHPTTGVHGVLAATMITAVLNTR